MKITVGISTVATLCALGSLTDYQTVSLWVLYVTLPVVVLFIAAYIPERPGRHWFGTSLLLLAVGVLAVCLSGILFRVYGAEYPFRELLGVTWIGFMYVSMVMRTWVLLAVQWKERSGVGGRIRRLFPKEVAHEQDR